MNTTTISWGDMGLHALWIVGLAMLLAVFSYRRYALTQQTAADGGRDLAKPHFFARFGLILVMLGFLAISDSWIEQGIWGVLLLVAIVEPMMNFFRRRRGSKVNRLAPVGHHGNQTSEI